MAELAPVLKEGRHQAQNGNGTDGWALIDETAQTEGPAWAGKESMNAGTSSKM